jgi:hypothetical protein
MPVIDIAVPEDFEEARTSIAGHLERFLLAKAQWGIGETNCFDHGWSQDLLSSCLFVRPPAVG